MGGTFTEDYYRFCIIKCVFEGASKDQFVPMLMFAFSIFGREGLYVIIMFFRLDWLRGFQKRSPVKIINYADLLVDIGLFVTILCEQF